MKKQDYEQLTLFPADSLASHSLLPGSTQASRMTVISGLKCSELLKSFSPLGLLVRTCLASSIWHSTRCYLTWRASVTKANRLLFRLVASTHGIKENGSVLWPTLLANGMGSTGHQKMLQKIVEKGWITAEEKKKMVQGNGGQINPIWAEWFQGYAKEWTGLLPTVRASDYKGSPKNRFIGGGGTDTIFRS